MAQEITVHLTEQGRRALDTLQAATEQDTDQLINQAIIKLLASSAITDWYGADNLDD